MVSVALPSDSVTTPQDVKMLYQKVEELVQKYLSIVTAPQPSGYDSSGSILYVMKNLVEVQKNFMDPSCLVRVMQRLARDMGTSNGGPSGQVQKSEIDSTAALIQQGADVGVVITNLKSVLKLISESVMLVPDCK